MQMYDVGMASMAALSDESLAELADAINRTQAASTLRARSAEARAKIAAHLWDEASGIFVNRFPTGDFNRRISPTSFYPMMAGAVTADRAAAMMHGCELGGGCSNPVIPASPVDRTALAPG
jgi:putative isomerase